MLGKLAKYLRFLGYDTYYPSGTMSDTEILVLAKSENRIVLTRDKELARRSKGLLIESDNYREQLKFVIRKFNLNTEQLLSRCSVCNTLLIEVPKQSVHGKVPAHVYEHNDKFFMCPKCQRIYWYGTHTERIKRDILAIVGDSFENRREREK